MIPGLPHFPTELDVTYSRIFLGAAWPGVRCGWCVVVGEHRMEQFFGLPRLDVLDEASCDRLWDLVGRLAALREYYHPERVLADGRDLAAWRFVEEVGKGAWRVEHSLLCEHDSPMAYAMPILQRVYDPGPKANRLAIPAGSRLVGELLTVPRTEDPAKLTLADYPGVAALSHAVLGLELTRPDAKSPPTEMARPERILR